MKRRIIPFVMMVCATAAQAQTVYVPAPQAPSRVAWRCLVKLQTSASDIASGRELDAEGRILTDHASWTELPGKETVPGSSLSLEWDANRRMEFNEGRLTFYLTASKPLARPDSFRFGPVGSATRQSVSAGRAYIDANKVISFIPLATWKQVAGKEPAFAWAFMAKRKELISGVQPNIRLAEVESRFPELLARLDAAQKNFTKRCIPVQPR